MWKRAGLAVWRILAAARGADAKRIFTFGRRRKPGAEWPRHGGRVRGRMHVAGGEEPGQPGRDPGPHSRTLEDSRGYYCAPLPKSPPTIYKRLAGAQKNIAAKWRRRLEQLPLGAAQSGHTLIAQRRTSPALHGLRDSVGTLYFSSTPASPHLACREPERSTVAILAPSASPPLSSKISLSALLMSA